eukprot:3112695-Alexandrium_andersonii.AAC.1
MEESPARLFIKRCPARRCRSAIPSSLTRAAAPPSGRGRENEAASQCSAAVVQLKPAAARKPKGDMKGCVVGSTVLLRGRHPLASTESLLLSSVMVQPFGA